MLLILFCLFIACLFVIYLFSFFFKSQNEAQQQGTHFFSSTNRRNWVRLYKIKSRHMQVQFNVIFTFINTYVTISSNNTDFYGTSTCENIKIFPLFFLQPKTSSTYVLIWKWPSSVECNKSHLRSHSHRQSCSTSLLYKCRNRCFPSPQGAKLCTIRKICKWLDLSSSLSQLRPN